MDLENTLKGSEVSQVTSDWSGCKEYPRWLEISQQIDSDPLSVDIDEYALVFNAVIDFKKKRLRAQVLEEPEIFWITVNPKPDVDIQLVLKCILNFCKRKAVKDYHFSIEQRGESEEEIGKGVHSHILVKWDRKQNKYVKQFLIESVKRLVGNYSNAILNIRRITFDIYQDKLDYLNGLKWDKEKDIKIHFDKIYRERNNILCIYKKSDDE